MGGLRTRNHDCNRGIKSSPQTSSIINKPKILLATKTGSLHPLAGRKSISEWWEAVPITDSKFPRRVEFCTSEEDI